MICPLFLQSKFLPLNNYCSINYYLYTCKEAYQQCTYINGGRSMVNENMEYQKQHNVDKLRNKT